MRMLAMRSIRLACGTALAVSALAATTAAAQAVRYDLDSGDALLADGFVLHEDPPSMSYSGGQLRIRTTMDTANGS
jgi:hypothetical protein